jgi:hypothetical protein
MMRGGGFGHQAIAIRIPGALLLLVMPSLLLLIATSASITRYGSASRSVGDEAATLFAVSLGMCLVIWLCGVLLRTGHLAFWRTGQRGSGGTWRRFAGRWAMTSAAFTGMGCLMALLVSVAAGSSTFGLRASSTHESEARGAVIKARAAALWGQDFDPGGGLVVGRESGLGVDRYVLGVRASNQGYESGGQQFNYWVSGDLYEEHGWPFRCVRTPVTTGLIVKELGDHLANLRILPFGFAANALLCCCAAIACLRGPTIVRGYLRHRRGQCVRCGYILKGLSRCPECGAEGPSAGGQNAQARDSG